MRAVSALWSWDENFSREETSHCAYNSLQIIIQGPLPNFEFWTEPVPSSFALSDANTWKTISLSSNADTSSGPLRPAASAPLTSQDPLGVAFEIQSPLVEGTGGHAHRPTHGSFPPPNRGSAHFRGGRGGGRTAPPTSRTASRTVPFPPTEPPHHARPWVERAPPMRQRGAERSAARISRSDSQVRGERYADWSKGWRGGGAKGQQSEERRWEARTLLWSGGNCWQVVWRLDG